MNFELKIREARPGDSPQMAEVHVKSWRRTYKGIIHQSYLDTGLDVNERTKRWYEDLSEGCRGTFLAIDGDVLAGFSAVGKSRNNRYPDYAELYAIYLDPNYFGKGVGKALFQRVFDYAIMRGFKKMFVNVLNDNKIARDFYERMGAVAIDNGEEGLILDGQSYLVTKYEWKELNP